MPKVKTLLDKVTYQPKPKRTEPLWKGPEDAGTMGGVTQSMLNAFLGCRERFRLRYVEGLQPIGGFNHTSAYGDMWHICEEALAANLPWELKLTAHCKQLCRQFPLQQEQVEKWFNVARIHFPIYVEYWKQHPDNLKRTPLMQEQVFHVPYTLPSGRTVYLRGKFDSVDLIGSGKQAAVYLMENKTKGDINVEKLQRQLTFDLQTMMYLVALGRLPNEYPRESPLKGVRYNVIRRPLLGGRGTIVRHEATKGAKCPKCKGNGKLNLGIPVKEYTCSKCGGDGRINAKPAESYESYYARLAAIIKEDCESSDPIRNQYWFSRWKVDVGPADIEKFKVQFLNPILEQLCDWYSWISYVNDNPWRTNVRVTVPDLIDKDVESRNRTVGPEVHWRHPFGTYNVLDEGGSTELDEYLNSGSEVGLTRDVRLFKELQ